MRHFRVAHDFKSEEAVELSVRKGQHVVAVDNVVQDGWIKVECTDDGGLRRGFVPLSYLQQITEDEAAQLRNERDAGTSPRHGSGPRQQVRTPSPRKDGRMTNAIGSAGRASSPRATRADAVTTWREDSHALGEAALQYGADMTSASPSRSPRGRSTNTAQHAEHTSRRSGTLDEEHGALTADAPLTPARASTGGAPIDRDLLSNPNTVVEAFMKNEVYFKQLMRRRADALAQMQGGLEEASREVNMCKDKNAALTRKLRDLDQVIEKERRRWTERLDEEKAFVSRSLSYVPGSALGLASGSSPRRQTTGSRQPSPTSGRVSTAVTFSAGSPSVY